jgi:uncharacterized protein YfaS (alpha-2-macroglobulin family)
MYNDKKIGVSVNKKINSPVYSSLILLILSLIFVGASSNMTSEENNFYLSNYSLFKPGDEAKVNIYSYSNRSLELDLTLLKANNPIKFFKSLSSNRKRYNFDIWGENNQFLLENTEKIKSWKDFIDKRNFYQDYLNVGKIENPGLYILQAKHQSQIAYCPILVTNYSIISKEFNSNLLAIVVDILTGDIIKNSEILGFDKNSNQKKFKTDKEGIFLEKITISNNEIQLFAKVKDEIIPFNIYSFFGRGNNWNLIGYIYTNQPVYRPSQVVNFKAILRLTKGNETKNFENQTCRVKITSPQNKTVFSDELTTNEFGTLNGSFKLDDEADLGNYSIEISQDNYRVYGNFSVEEYKKPEFKVVVNTDLNHYSAGDTINGSVSAEYYFGAKVKNASVKVSIFKQQYWFPWWRGHRFAWFYDSFEKVRPYPGFGNELIKQIQGELDENGIFNFSLEPLNEKESDFRYNIVAEVTDQSRRAISGSKEVLVSRGLFSISSSTEKYFYQQNEEVKIKVNITDFDEKGVQTDFKVIVNYPEDKLYRPAQVKDTINGKTNHNGIGLALFKPRGNFSGYFSYQVIAIDKKGNEVTSGGYFYVGDYRNYFQTRFSNQIEIVTDKDVYEIGDTLTAIIFTPIESQQFLLTFETDEVLSYKVLTSKNHSAKFEYVIKDNLAPNFNISVCFINNKMFYQNSKSVGVIPNEKYLSIEIKTEKDRYKPRDKVEYSLFVKNSKGEPVKNAELSFGLTDESLYDIVSEQIQSIDKFFFAPRYFYVSSYSSTTNFYFNSISRPITYLEEFYFDRKKSDIPYNLNYYGRFTNTDSIFQKNKLKAVLIGTITSFAVPIDSFDNFEFKKIPADKYQLYISNFVGDLVFIKDLVLTSDLREQVKLNKSLLEKIQRLIEKENQVDNIRDFGGREGIMNLTQEAMPLTKAYTNGLAKSDFVRPEIRKEFMDAITWLPNVYTDSKGRAKVEVKLPDNLGTWRATVRGVTKETMVGEQIQKIISTKNLLIRVETPRFLTQGDEVTISTIVHNYLNTTKKTRIDFNVENLKLISSEINSKLDFRNLSNIKNEYEVNLPANSEIRIDWKVKSETAKNEAVFRAAALTNEESDAIETRIPIHPQGIKIQNPISFDSNEKDFKKEIDFEIPPGIDLNSVNFTFSINPTLTTSLLKTLDELVGYPYGCVEQTMSRFLPTLYVNNFLKTQNIKVSSSVIENMPNYVEEGIKRLIDFQQPDGGWGWWKNDRSNPFMTAYVLYGLNFAQLNGFNVYENVIQNGIRNLELQIEDFKEKEETTKLAYMIYVYSEVTKNRKTERANKVKEKLDAFSKGNLDSYSLSLMILTYKNFGATNTASNLVSKLISQVNQSVQFAFWDMKESNYYWHNDEIQTTAYSVKALIESSSEDELITKAIRWLMMKRQGYSWTSTQTSAMVLFAITDYLKTKNELSPNYSVTVSLNGKEIFKKSYNEKDILTDQPVIKLNESQKNLLIKGKNKLTIEKTGDGSVYLSGMLSYFSNQFTTDSKFFKVERNYFILEPVQQKDRIIFKKKKFDGKILVGQDLLVETTIKSKASNLEYLISEDMLPAGFEVVKDLNNYQIDGNDYSTDPRFDYYPIYDYSHREYRDEKAVFFSTYFNKKVTFRYIIKAQIPGEYNINPAQSYLMYYPEFSGNTEKRKVAVKEKK